MNKVFKKAISIVSALAVTASVSSATVFAGSSDENFYSTVADLVSDTWSDDFVGSVKLKIGSTSMDVDGIEVDVDEGRSTVPEIMNGRTMLPIRAVVEKLGGEIGWDSKTGDITIEMDDIEIRMKEGSDKLYVNGDAVKVDTPPVIKNDRTMVPVRAITENLLCDVQWDAESQTVTIIKEYQTKRIVVKGDISKSDYNKFNPVEVIENDDITVLQFDTMEEAKECCEALSKLSRVDFAEPDAYIPPVVEEHDNGTTVSSTFNSWGVNYINADKYANYVKDVAGDETVKVAVIDTGVCAQHSFLKGKVDTSAGRDFINGDSDASDDHGHGTHVAGTIVDCMPGLDVEIVPIKVLSASGSGTSLTVANGIEYAGDIGVDVVNLSLGGPSGNCSYKDSIIKDAMNKGVAFAVAAGNESQNVANVCPAHITGDGLVVVAAHDSSGTAAYFSNYGDGVDVAAPGVNIKSTIPSNGYDSWNGTSMATPHVAACLAMIKLANPDITPANAEKELKKALSEKCVPYYSGQSYGKTIDMSKLAKAPEKKEIKEFRWMVDGSVNNANTLTLTVGNTAQLDIVAVYTDNSTEKVTDKYGMAPLYSGIVEVSGTGLVKAIAAGEVYIEFTGTKSNDVKVPRDLKIVVEEKKNEKELVSYKWKVNGNDADEVTLNTGDTAQIDLYGVYEDSEGNTSEKNVTKEAGLVINDSGKEVAEISGTGLLKALQKGSARVEFTNAVESDVSVPKDLKVTVNEKAETSPRGDVVKLEWSESNIFIKVGQEYQLKLNATYENGDVEEMVARCKPYSLIDGFATVDSEGVVTGVNRGITFIGIESIPNAKLKMPGKVMVTVK